MPKIVDVVIAAREEMQRGLDAALGKVKSFRGKLDEFGKGADPTGLLAGGLKIGLAVSAAKAGLSALTAGVHLMRGEWDKVGDALQRLPLGIGQVVRGVRELWAVMSDSAAEAERIKKIEDEIAAGRKTRIDAEEATAGTVGKRLSALKAENKLLLAANDAVREQVKIDRDLADSLAVVAAARKTGSQSLFDIQRLEEQAYLQAGLKRRDIELKQVAERKELLKKEEAERQQLVKRNADAFERAQKDQANDRADELKRTLDLESDLRQQQFRANGDLLRADEERIRRHYQTLRDEAGATQRELLDRLEAGELVEARRKTAGGAPERVPIGVEAALVTSQFSGITKQAEVGERQRTAIEKVQKATEQVRDEVKRLNDKLTFSGIEL